MVCGFEHKIAETIALDASIKARRLWSVLHHAPRARQASELRGQSSTPGFKCLGTSSSRNTTARLFCGGVRCSARIARSGHAPWRCTPQIALARDLTTSKRGIGAIALAPAFVAAKAAVGDTPVAVPHDVPGREVVTTPALCDAWRSGPTGGWCRDPQVIEVHAAPAATGILYPRRRGKGPAARLVQPPARGRDRTACGPQATAPRVALDRLPAVWQHAKLHAVMVCSRQPYGP